MVRGSDRHFEGRRVAMGHFGFSAVGLLYLLMLAVPSIMWAQRKPEGYSPSNEKRILLVFERVGQVLCTITVLFFADTNPQAFEPWIAWLIASAFLMALYEGYWIRYFRSRRTLQDFYRPFLKVPAPGATLPVAAFLFLGIYGQLIWLITASAIFGIGHIGIHLQHLQSMKSER